MVSLKSVRVERPLAALPPGHRLKGVKLKAWVAACDQEAALLKPALDRWCTGERGPTMELDFLNAVISLLSLPASSLIPITGLTPAHGTVTVQIDPAFGVSPGLTIPPIDLGPPPPKKPH